MRCFVIALLLSSVCLNTVYAQSELEKGKELFKSRKYSEAKAVCESILSRSNYHAEANYLLGSIYLRHEQDYDKAIEYLEKAVDSEPNNSNYHLTLSGALGNKAMRSNVVKQALLAPRIKSEMEKAVELDPNNIEARTALSQFYVMAPGIMGGSVEKAKRQADAILALDAYRGYVTYANIYNRQEDWDQAENYYKKAIAVNPQKALPYHQLGYLYLRMKRHAEAVAQFQRMVQFDPDNANSYDSLGDGYLANGQLDEALDSYRKAVNIDPQFAPSVFNLASCYEKKQMKQEAKEYYKRYLVLTPTGSQADEARAKIKD